MRQSGVTTTVSSLPSTVAVNAIGPGGTFVASVVRWDWPIAVAERNEPFLKALGKELGLNVDLELVWNQVLEMQQNRVALAQQLDQQVATISDAQQPGCSTAEVEAGEPVDDKNEEQLLKAMANCQMD